jgi:D-alanyl-D-alanine carboxypeptidase (penicillin-binding protein 5/6)
MKTGHTDDAGYCLIASAQQNGMRLIAVVLGAPSDAERANDSEALLKYGFRFFETHKVYNANQVLAQVRVWGGTDKMVNIGVTSDAYITVPNGSYKDLKLDTQLNSDIEAPVTKGQQLGKLNVNLNGQTIMTIPLVALQDDAKGGMLRRFFDWLGRKF